MIVLLSILKPGDLFAKASDSLAVNKLDTSIWIHAVNDKKMCQLKNAELYECISNCQNTCVDCSELFPSRFLKSDPKEKQSILCFNNSTLYHIFL